MNQSITLMGSFKRLIEKSESTAKHTQQGQMQLKRDLYPIIKIKQTLIKRRQNLKNVAIHANT